MSAHIDRVADPDLEGLVGAIRRGHRSSGSAPGDGVTNS
jgi:hypothetical protein